MRLTATAEVLGLALLSLFLACAPALPRLGTTPLEAWAAISYVWSVWLLARNHPAGWLVGIAGVVLYGRLFWEVRLFGEVALQGFYFVTSLQAIWIWRRQRGASASLPERPVGRAPVAWVAGALVLGSLGVIGLRWALLERAGAAPFWDALTTVVSVIAHLYLMGRWVESWYLWIAVDTIYVPLYASRELYLTAGLYAVFWVLAVRGLLHFRRLYAERLEAERGDGSGPAPVVEAPCA